MPAQRLAQSGEGYESDSVNLISHLPCCHAPIHLTRVVMKRGELDSLIKLASLSVHLSKYTYHSSDCLQLSGSRAGKCQILFILFKFSWPWTISLFCNSLLLQVAGGHIGLEQPRQCSPVGMRNLVGSRMFSLHGPDRLSQREIKDCGE